MSAPIEVTAHDPVHGESDTQLVYPHGYCLVLGEQMKVSSMQRWPNGTVQLTLKRKAAES